jgi:hypothetical protein
MPILKLDDYTLDPDGLDWGDLLASWAWLLPAEFTLWFANRFGDLFIVLDDDSVQKLDVGTGALEALAESREAFSEAMDDIGNANDWLMIPLVDDLVAAGVTLGPGQCYSYVQLPVLGGDYSVENIRVVSLEQNYRALGAVHKKIKGLADGTQAASPTD